MKKITAFLLSLLLVLGMVPAMTASAATVISEVDIRVVAPVAGRTPNYSSNVDTAGVFLDTEDTTYGECQKNGVIWFQGEVPIRPTDTFEVGKEYTVRVLVYCDSSSYEFQTSPAVNATINGQTAWIQYGNSVYQSIEYTFPAVEGHTVSFSAGLGSGSMAPVSNIAGNYTIPECTFTAPSGKVFKSWLIGSEEWFPGETYLVLEDITLVAQWKPASNRQQVFNVVATSEDLESIPKLYERVKIPSFTITQGAPAYIAASTGNLSWMKKNGETWEYYYGNYFVPGEWRIGTQVRIDRDSALTYELGNPVSLTVNGEAWPAANGTGTPYVDITYSMILVNSPVFVIEDDPSKAPPAIVENVKLSLKGYEIGAAAEDAEVVTDSNVVIKSINFGQMVDLNNDGAFDNIEDVNAPFSAQNTYAVQVIFGSKSGYDISQLTKSQVSLEQSMLTDVGIYDENTDSFILVCILKAPTASKVSIVANPANGYATEGAKASVSVGAEGEGLKYTWYVKNAGATKFTKSSITKSTYSVTMSSSVHGRQVYCVVSDKYGNKATSAKVYLRRKATVTSQPSATLYAKKGAKVSTKITAVGDGLKYTWYYKNSGSSKFSKSSVTSSTYSVSIDSKTKNRQIYCIVTDKYGYKAQSKTITLRESASITTQPKTGYAKYGETAKVSVKASGDTLKYTWYVKNAGATKFTKSSITKSYYSVKMSSTTKNRQVYCVVTDKYGKKVTSKTVYLREAVSITTQPKTTTVKKNTTAKVSVKARGDSLKYAWYVKNAGASKYTKSSITKSYYSVKMTSKVNGRYLYCVVTDKYGKTAKTETVRIKMK